MSTLLGSLWQVIHEFNRHEAGVTRPVEFWLNMLESQVAEARAHLKAGHVDKALNEIADCHVISFEALHRSGKHPTSFVVNRIHTRILPRIDELHARYHAGDGHKDGGAN
jgi:hypothetical protein